MEYYDDLLAAWVRGRVAELSGEELLELSRRMEWRVHRFKRNAELPRVRKVLGLLRALQPQSLLDLGTGRGVFLWPLLDEFPDLAVTCLDQRQDRVDDILRVAGGGVARLSAFAGDIAELPFHDGEFDLVTALEVLEHQSDPAPAIREACRVASRFVIASAPLHDDNNPEHVTLFTGERFEELFRAAGAARVSVEYVPNHIVAVARL